MQPDPDPGSGTPIACRLDAFSPAQRARHAELLGLLRKRIELVEERPDGLALRLPKDDVALLQAAEWITLERRCCPFLSFELTSCGAEGTWLAVTGPQDAKAVISETLATG